ncbi:MAG: ABC transporter permease [Dehalococcoidia bacterium]|nr:ABC transporter permease [Dehalococcoidia bacterium]
MSRRDVAGSSLLLGGQATPYPEGRAESGVWRRLGRQKGAVLGAAAICLLVLIAVIGPAITPYHYARQNYDEIYVLPGADHWLGTDGLGRDVLSRLVQGARTSLAVGITSQLVVLCIGLAVGTLAAMGGRVLDGILMRFTDVVFAFPDLLFILLLRAVFGGGLFMIILAIALVQWATIARLVRAQLLSMKGRDFALAAKAVGAGDARIVFRHLLPNSLGPVIVALTFGVPQAIFAEAALSFIGIGVAPPLPSWGSMVQDGYRAIYAYPHLVLSPAAAIAVLMLAFTLLGDGLRDALDPRRR